MIYIAIILYVVGVLCPKWILRDRYSELVKNFSWKVSLFKLSGIVTSLILSFIILSVVTLNSKDRYVLNDNAIYGLEFSETMEDIGFIDGDRVLSINGKKVDRVYNIIPQIIQQFGEIAINIERAGQVKKIVVSQKDVYRIIQQNAQKHIEPIMNDNSINSSDSQQVIISESGYGMSDVVSRYKHLMGGFLVILNVKNVQGYFILLVRFLILISLLNLIPLPGFGLGNMVVSIIENRKKQRYNQRSMRYIRIISVAVTVLLLLVL